MNLTKKFALLLLVAVSLVGTGCINVFEEITMRKNGSGKYAMNIDMSQMKSMMEMLKGMGGDSTATEEGAENPMGQLGEMGAAMEAMGDMIKGIRGISNVKSSMDTATFMMGYSFDFADSKALNKAFRKLAEQGGEGAAADLPEEVFKVSGKGFERVDASGGMADEIMKQLGGGAGGEAEQMKMFFADMTIRTVYSFPDQTVKKGDHAYGKIADDKKSYVIEVKPFGEGVDLKKAGNAVKLKIK